MKGTTQAKVSDLSNRGLYPKEGKKWTWEKTEKQHQLPLQQK